MPERSEEDRAYDWALNKCCRLIDSNQYEESIDDEWWALLRCLWKARLGLDPRKPQRIGPQYVDV